MADDDGTQAVGRGAERERALGVQPPGVRNDGERVRPIGGDHGAAQLDRVCLPPEDERRSGVTRARTHRHARYHDGHCSTSVNRSHTRSTEAGITISLRTSIGGRGAVLTGRSSRAETRVSHSRGMNRPLAAISLFRTPGMTTARPLSRARSPASMTGSGSASRL